MGLYSGGFIIGRISASEIWGLVFGRAYLFIYLFIYSFIHLFYFIIMIIFFLGGGGGEGGAYYRNFTGTFRALQTQTEASAHALDERLCWPINHQLAITRLSSFLSFNKMISQHPFVNILTL